MMPVRNGLIWLTLISAIFISLLQCITTLIKAIASLGHALIDNNDTADALSFLEYGISIGSDISSNYIDLAIIYAATDRFDDIRKLKEKAGMLKSLSRDNIIEQLNNMLK